MRGASGIAHFVRQDLGFTERIHEGGTTSTRGTFATLMRLGPSKANEKRRTDDHDGELDTLLDVFATSATAGHGDY